VICTITCGRLARAGLSQRGPARFAQRQEELATGWPLGDVDGERKIPSGHYPATLKETTPAGTETNTPGKGVLNNAMAFAM